MGIIKYFRKKYWEAAIFRGGRRIPFSCDGLTAVPDRAYALFTEKELEKMKRMNGLDLQNESLFIQKQNSTISLMEIGILISYIITRIGTIILEI